MFITRLISGIILIILSLGVLYVGGMLTLLVTMGLSLVGVYEIMRVYKLEKQLPAWVAYITTVCYYGVLMLGKNDLTIPVMIVYLLVVLAVYVLTFPKYKDSEIGMTFLAFFYVSVSLSYIYQVRMIENGWHLVALVFICSWGNDTLAYCTGRLFGKHKMSPVLSPKKSVEGLIGGIVGAGILGLLFGFYYRFMVADAPVNSPLIFAIVSAIGAIPAVIGDLAASAIKRNNDVKDYGKLIPGHGGVMDRFDSMIFTAPIIYYGLQIALQNGF